MTNEKEVNEAKPVNQEVQSDDTENQETLQEQAPAQDDNKSSNEKDEESKQASRLKNFLLSNISFYKDSKTSEFHFSVKGESTAYNVRSSKAQRLLMGLYFQKTKEIVTIGKIREVVNLISGLMERSGIPETVYNRVARDKEKNIIMLDNNAYIAIDENGWNIENTSPVKFKNKEESSFLVIPVKDVEDNPLYNYIRVKEFKDKQVLDAFIMSCLLDMKSYAILLVSGPYGSAKSTCCRYIKMLVDMRRSLLSKIPKNEDDIILLCQTHSLIVLDNLSSIKLNVSDTLCMVTSGAYLNKRKLYSDSEIISVACKNPMIINGLHSPLYKGDVISRSLHLRLAKINPEDMKPLEEVDKEFIKDLPKILGYYLNLLSKTLKCKKLVPKESKFSRLGDLGALGEAMLIAKGFEDKSFFSIINDQSLESLATSLLENDFISPVLGQLSDYFNSEQPLDREIKITKLASIMSGKLQRPNLTPERAGKIIRKHEQDFFNIGVQITPRRTSSKRSILFSYVKPEIFERYIYSRYEEEL